MRILRQRFAGKFKRCYGLLSRYGRKRLQEVVDRVSGLKIVKKIPYRDAGADEHGHATLNFGV